MLMTRWVSGRGWWLAGGCFVVIPLLLSIGLSGAPSVYPTGTTIYHPDRTWNGYTVFITPESEGVILIDMNGRVVKQWTGLSGAAGGPARILPGGYVIAGTGGGAPHQESMALVQLDWNGKEIWRFDRGEQVQTQDGKTMWSARQHHDWQRPDFAAGYYAPGSQPAVSNGATLVLAHHNVTKPEVSERRLEDDRLLEVSWDGKVLWEWHASDHVDELGFSDEARAVIRTGIGFNRARDSYDWLHVNAASYVGPNRWYDQGDARFAPDNVLISSRESNIIAIVGRNGRIVWRMGPDYRESEALRQLGQIIGQHNPHIVPKGLSGAGNLLVFDNGGAAGYGSANPASPDGRNSVRRGNSRVVEVNPVTFEKVWEYSVAGAESYRFFSHYVSGAQRLANGNTMITEGADGRIFEVTPNGEIVWEYVSPYFTQNGGTNRVYRAYRVPYEWIPQLARPAERAVIPPNVREFRIAPQ
jgi:hypothetical protein